jgi:glycosyltransferase involved in cell wall biosynthesis
MSNAVLEYLAAGRTVVATNVGANDELIEDGVSGLLVPSGDAEQLASALDRVLSDPDFAEKLGSAARQRVERQYSREAMVRRYQEFYRSLAETRSARRRDREV